MVMLYTNPNEMQYGMKYGYVLQAGLSGIAINSDDCIIEVLVKEYIQDRSFIIKNANRPNYFVIGTAGFANYFWIYQEAVATERILIEQLAPYFTNGRRVNLIYRNVLHYWFIMRSVSCTMFTNGNETMASTVKGAHNIASTDIRFFSNNTVGGVSCPSIGCIARVYIGDFSGLSDAQLLAIHRKYLRTPFITPLELAPYEAFRFTGRQPDGSQILAASTNVYNEAPLSAGYGETLAIQGGLNWGQIREPIWTPR